MPPSSLSFLMENIEVKSKELLTDANIEIYHARRENISTGTMHQEAKT